MELLAFASGAAALMAGPVAPATPAARSFACPDHPAFRATLGNAVTLAGPGLHTGRRTRATVAPAEPGRGIVFRRALPGGPREVRADWTRRVSRPLCTSLALDGTRIVRTVEHLLAALAALRIDDALVELDGEELPILDGSARPWCRALAAAGRVESAMLRRYLRVVRPVAHVDGGRSVAFAPAERLSLDVRIALMGFGPLRWSGEIDAARFVAELAPSRSFGRLKWALPTKLYALATGRPLLRGAGLRSTAVLVGGRVLGGMTVPDEPVRHRALDLVGDLALAGLPILARITAKDPGHEINAAALGALMRDRTAWEIVDADGRLSAPPG